MAPPQPQHPASCQSLPVGPVLRLSSFISSEVTVLPRLQSPPKTNKESESVCKGKEPLFKLLFGPFVCLTQSSEGLELSWGGLFFFIIVEVRVRNF